MITRLPLAWPAYIHNASLSEVCIMPSPLPLRQLTESLASAGKAGKRGDPTEEQLLKEHQDKHRSLKASRDAERSERRKKWRERSRAAVMSPTGPTVVDSLPSRLCKAWRTKPSTRTNQSLDLLLPS